MSQATLNLRQKVQDKLSYKGRRNGIQTAGIIFLLLIFSTILEGSIVALKWVNDSSRLPISRLIVIGQQHYTTNDDIRKAILSLGKPGTFMSQDVNVIQKKIQALPWIKRVSVRKQWPDKLKIHLIEYVPVAYWNDSKVIDIEGKSFSMPANNIKKKSSLPFLYGPEGNEKDVLNRYRQMSTILTTNKIYVKAVFMTARYSWHLVTDDNVRIELGRSDNINRLQRFIELWPIIRQDTIINNKQHISYVDLRYDCGAAVGYSGTY